MAYGTTVLIKNQWGKEAVHGTAVAADTGLIGTIELPSSDRDIIVPKAGSGRRVPGIPGNAYVGRVAAQGIRYNCETPYFQILPMLLSACIRGGLTPAETNIGEGDYAWLFTDNLTAAEDLDTFTLETGEAAASNSWEIAYCLVPSLEISGNCDTGEASISATIDGDAILPTTLTAAIAQPTATAMIPQLMILSIDDTWAGLGGTPVTAALVDWTLTVEGGAHHKRRGGANRKPTGHGQGEIMIRLNLGLERTAAVVAEIGYLQAETVTPRFVRMVLDSGVIIGSGANHTLTVDLCGVWKEGPITGRDLDGNDLVELVLECGYDVTGTHAFDIDIITNVATL